MVAIRTTSLIFASVSLLSSYVNAYGQIAQVVDANNFCVFLPPNDSEDRIISDTEWNAQAFCIGDTPKAINAGKLNSGFIQSAHYLKTDEYVQVTGQINPAKAKLIASDEGGQMDIKAPKGSSCAGWKYYVNLIEPAGNTYCMRCCNDDRTCNRGISEKGCAHIIPGDYSGPNGGSSDDDDATTTTTTTTKAKTTKTTTTKSKTTTTKKATTTTTKESTSTTDKAVATETAEATETTATTATTTTTVADAAKATTDASASDASSGDSGDAAVPTNGDAQDATTTATPAAANNESVNASTSAADATTTPSTEMLGQNNMVSEQSVNGADQFQPTIMTLAAVMVTMAMMMLQ